MLQSTHARFDLDRITEGFRAAAGDEVAELARREYGDDPISDDEWDRVFAAFGPRVPDREQLARRVKNENVDASGEHFTEFDVVDQLARIDCPTLVCVGSLDSVTPIDAAREIVDALPRDIGQLRVIDGVGHFPWLDAPERYWPVIEDFVTGVHNLR